MTTAKSHTAQSTTTSLDPSIAQAPRRFPVRVAPSLDGARLAAGRRLLLVLLVMGGGLWPAVAEAAAGQKAAGEGAEKKDQQKPVVSLTIDYADGVQKRFVAIPWKSDMTVLDAMQWAERHPRGIGIKYRGSGATAFLTQIDDLENEGGGQRNWIYRVNGKLGDRGFGVRKLEPDDAVVWRFEKYRPGRQ